MAQPVSVNRYPNGALKDSTRGVAEELEKFYFYPNGVLMAHERIGLGKLNGPAEYYYPDGKRQSVERWDYGRQEDSSWYYHPNGTLHRAGIFQNGLYQGRWLTYLPTGQLERIGHYNRGLPDSVWTLYGEDGRPLEKVEYAEGVPNGKAEFFVNGKISSEGQYKNGKMFGKWYFYKRNGKLRKTKSFDARD